MFNNRDNQRTNKANKAVKACLFGKITKDTLSFIQRNCPNLSQQGQVQVNHLLKIANISNDKMVEHFCKSADSISKETCMSYSTGQHNLILQAMKNKENISSVKCISPYVIDSDLLSMCKTFTNLTTSNGKYIYFVFFAIYHYFNDSSIIVSHMTPQTGNVNDAEMENIIENLHTTTLHNPPVSSAALETEINAFILRKLPARISNTYYSPYHVASFLLQFKKVKIMGVKVSRKRLMKHMITYKYVPVKQTNLYKICRKLKLKDLPQDASWTELQKRGRKPIISDRALQELIDEIKMSTDGGVAMSTSDVKELIIRRIKAEWNSKGKLHCLPRISTNTLNIYSNIIKSQSIFNVHSSTIVCLHKSSAFYCHCQICYMKGAC